MSKWRFRLAHLLRRLWVHAVVFAVYAVFAVALASVGGAYVEFGARSRAAAQSVEGILAIIATSIGGRGP